MSILTTLDTDEIVATAIAAGQLIRRMRHDGQSHSAKSDGSPVTDADLAAEQLIVSALARLAPNVPVVAEESAAAFDAATNLTNGFFLVDPLDGTKEYVRGQSDYTVNIALVENGAPVFGVVAAPDLQTVYVGADGAARMLTIDGQSKITCETAISVREPGAPLTAIVSRSHFDPITEAYLSGGDNKETLSVGSSLKFCRVASGEADVYPRLGRTMQWDTAAGDAVLRSAGGMTFDMNGKTLAYGRNAADGDPHPFANGKFISFGKWCDEAMRDEAVRCADLIARF